MLNVFDMGDLDLEQLSSNHDDKLNLSMKENFECHSCYNCNPGITDTPRVFKNRIQDRRHYVPPPDDNFQIDLFIPDAGITIPMNPLCKSNVSKEKELKIEEVSKAKMIQKPKKKRARVSKSEKCKHNPRCRKVFRLSSKWSHIEEVILVGVVFDRFFNQGSLNSNMGMKGETSTWETLQKIFNDYLEQARRRLGPCNIVIHRSSEALSRHFKVMKARINHEKNPVCFRKFFWEYHQFCNEYAVIKVAGCNCCEDKTY